MRWLSSLRHRLTYGYEPDRMPFTRGDAVAVVLVAVAAWMTFCALAARAADRVRTLACAENYALAVYDQVLYRYTDTGRWSQTIHFGYVDSWDWSGHLSVWIYPVAEIYRRWPGPVTLVTVQVAAVVAGAAPLYALGRRAFGVGSSASPVGGLVCALGYLLWPALWGVALADYQDLVLGVPFLIAAYAASQAGSARGMALAALATCAAREEWLLLVPFVPLAAPGGLREKARQAVLLGLALAPYALLLAEARGAAVPRPGVGDSAAERAVSTLLNRGVPLARFLEWPPPFTRTVEDVRWFYTPFLEPAAWLAVFSPAAMLPAALAWFMHACSPPEGGVDARWLGHIHHMAPIAAFLAVGATLAGSEALHASRVAWLRGRAARVAVGIGWSGAVLLTLLAAYDSRTVLPWLRLEPRLTPASRAEPAPEWALLAVHVPPDAAIATDARGSTLIATRAEAYTYDESLLEKTANRGLAALDFILVRRTDTAWLDRVRARTGARELGGTADYVLYAL